MKKFTLTVSCLKKMILPVSFLFLLCLFTTLSASAESAKDTTQPAPAPAPVTSPLSTPGMAGPLTINPNPEMFHSSALGDVYVSGVVSGLWQLQNNVSPGDRTSQVDLSNGQIFIQKVTGVVQFFVQAGAYSLPDIGLPYIRAGNTYDQVPGATNTFFGVMPQAFIKIAPSNNFSIMAGKLPTLIGAEYTFSFENMNIERGLLWNQENAVNRGVQLNYKVGPLAVALSWNDGMYSNQYSWAWASLTYSINATNTLALIGSGNTKITNINTASTPLYQNNEQLYNVIYTRTTGPWTIEPYLQYTMVPKNLAILKTTQDASTLGGALFINYAIPTKAKDASFNLPLRLEYINSTGSAAGGAPNLLYGQGSNAWSVTVTPTYQYKQFFGRAELSYVGAGNITSGSAFGPSGTSASQARLLFEMGMLF
ncbi:MAG: outer membrane beta-barrel protein [Chitinophagaceae bacterium]